MKRTYLQNKLRKGYFDFVYFLVAIRSLGAHALVNNRKAETVMFTD